MINNRRIKLLPILTPKNGNISSLIWSQDSSILIKSLSLALFLIEDLKSVNAYANLE